MFSVMKFLCFLLWASDNKNVILFNTGIFHNNTPSFFFFRFIEIMTKQFIEIEQRVLRICYGIIVSSDESKNIY